jgi:hypothetical protein
MYKSAITRTISLFAIVIFFSFSKVNVQAQSADYKNSPEWIKMIDDPNANYFEAIKAYETYWKYHEKPKNEEEEMEEMAQMNYSEKMTEEEKEKIEKAHREKEEEMKHDQNKTLTEAEMKALAEKQEMTYQCKRFENWIHEVKPFVQEDGRILSQEERMKIYNQQIEEQRKQNKK